jgi:Domain of unknown function (DUF397)
MNLGDDASGSVWRKSARCGANAGCVEVARLTREHIGVRDSKIIATTPILSFSSGEWRSFLGAVKTGRLDLT